jgi:oligoribonuclease
MLVWMDLEMTGLDHTSDVIVEIATLVTDDDLQVVAEGPDLVVHQPDDVLARMDPFVVDMHTKSGLLDQIKASTISLEAAGAATLEFIREHAPVARTVPLCGNSIGTDRRFLAAYLPEIEEYLHYRSVDVSSLKELVRRWYPDVLTQRGWKHGAHRALDDIRESVAELQLYRDLVFCDPDEVAVRLATIQAAVAAAGSAPEADIASTGSSDSTNDASDVAGVVTGAIPGVDPHAP